MGIYLCCRIKKLKFLFTTFCQQKVVPTDAAEREQRGLAHYAEPRGGNEDSLLVIMNYKKTAGAISRLSPLYEPSIYSL